MVNMREPSTIFSDGSVIIKWSLTVINVIYLKVLIVSLVLK